MKRKKTGKSAYGEKTEIVNFKCPISKKYEFKEKGYEILDGYAKELTTKKL